MDEKMRAFVIYLNEEEVRCIEKAAEEHLRGFKEELRHLLRMSLDLQTCPYDRRMDPGKCKEVKDAG